MAASNDSIDGLKSFPEVLVRDERWQWLGNRSLEQHYKLIEGYALHAGVPAKVAQEYENARTVWLYAFFSYRLLHVALTQLHLAGEVAIKERARIEGVNMKSKTLMDLLEIALQQRWLLDIHFQVTADRAEREAHHLEESRLMGIDREPFVGPLHEQDYAKKLVSAFRGIRNSLAHGEVILKPNISWEFLAVRDLINQLFPETPPGPRT